MRDTIEHKRLTFKVEIIPDDHGLGAPWKEHDGHGIISEWTRQGKAPGERLLFKDRHGAKLYYDIQATTRVAWRDGWGLGEKELAELAARLGREPKRGDIIAEAVNRDYERMRQWCEGDWYWCGVVVTLLDTDGQPTSEAESLWGIESDCREYHREVALELAAEVASKIGKRKFLEKRVRVRS